MDKAHFTQQTQDILCCFFDEPYLETDAGNEFDPVKIANKLKQLGDHYDETVIQPLMRNIQKASATDQAAVFTDSVDVLCNSWVAEGPEVTREKCLLKATMALSLYIKNNCPDLTSNVRGAIFNILNNRLGGWIMQQGGWGQL
ncbi:bcl-2-like protein 15 isoform X1 [Silurus meridionalis]|uniref:Bcl-2-like protein 15 n=1 Tax=Silurus meridionalis TaxID=175797 RepID=A0A8T0AKT5_SILME|nr:bcl-2-like protein 15 isoform X1 [Silurus meridionalis]KAF7693355.1 hypothetical protein HF521_008671 [Silurus meridionalis]